MTASDGPSRDRVKEYAIRGKWLVRVSLLFALCLEVIPIEPDIIAILSLNGGVLLMLAVKVTCLTLILLPLVIYLVLNGLIALKCVRGRVIIVAIIVTINLAYNFLVLCGKNWAAG